MGVCCILYKYRVMKKITLKQAEYKQPLCEIVDLTAETSYMLTSSGIESGDYEEDEW